MEQADRFGFKSEDDNSIRSEAILKRDNARIEKWLEMLPEIKQLMESQDSKLKSRIRKGIPDSLRGQVWLHLAKVSKLKQTLNVDFNDLINQESVHEKQIRLDVSRTFPNNVFFDKEDPKLFEPLVKVLKGISLLFPQMGYCQGLNFIADDESAFYLLAAVLKNYQSIDMYIDLEQINKPLFVYSQLMKKYLPKVHGHLTQYQVDPLLYATSWFLTLFTGNLPFKLIVRIIDIYLYEGSKIIFRASLAILKIKSNDILNLKAIDKIMAVLQNLENDKDLFNDDLFIETCLSFTFSAKLIPELESQYK